MAEDDTANTFSTLSMNEEFTLGSRYVPTPLRRAPSIPRREAKRGRKENPFSEFYAMTAIVEEGEEEEDDDQDNTTTGEENEDDDEQKSGLGNTGIDRAYGQFLLSNFFTKKYFYQVICSQAL